MQYINLILILLYACSSPNSQNQRTENIVWKVFDSKDSMQIKGIDELLKSINALENRVLQYQVLKERCNVCYSIESRGIVIIKTANDSSFYFKYDGASLNATKLRSCTKQLSNQIDLLHNQIKANLPDTNLVMEAQIAHEIYAKDLTLIEGIATECTLSDLIHDKLYLLLEEW